MPKKSYVKATKKGTKKPKGGHKHKTEIPKAPVRRLLRESGAKVSETAVDEVVRQTEERIRKAGDKAQKLAHHAGRKTIKTSDVRLDGVQ